MYPQKKNYLEGKKYLKTKNARQNFAETKKNKRAASTHFTRDLKKMHTKLKSKVRE